jgi:hypothetical protein
LLVAAIFPSYYVSLYVDVAYIGSTGDSAKANAQGFDVMIQYLSALILQYSLGDTILLALRSHILLLRAVPVNVGHSLMPFLTFAVDDIARPSQLRMIPTRDRNINPGGSLDIYRCCWQNR